MVVSNPIPTRKNVKTKEPETPVSDNGGGNSTSLGDSDENANSEDENLTPEEKKKKEAADAVKLQWLLKQ